MIVNRAKAKRSRVPAIGMFAPATKYQERTERRPSEPARAKAVAGMVSVKRERVCTNLAREKNSDINIPC